MHKYLRTLAAVVLSYQATSGVSALQAADWSDNISQDIPMLEQHIETAKRMGDLEKKIGQRIGKLTFFVVLADSDEDYIKILTKEIQGKSKYSVSLKPMSFKNYYQLVLEPPKTD